MTSLNKYHGSGRLLDTTELAIRRHKLTPKYVCKHPLVGPAKSYDQGRNANKRLARKIHGVRK